MTNIIGIPECIKKEEHIWIRKIETKFVILDPRQLTLNELDAKYQLFHVVLDMSNNGDKTAPLLVERCFDGLNATLERFAIIGEPTFDTLLEWVNLYGGNSFYKNKVKNSISIDLYEQLKWKRGDVDEKNYDIAFIWND